MNFGSRGRSPRVHQIAADVRPGNRGSLPRSPFFDLRPLCVVPRRGVPPLSVGFTGNAGRKASPPARHRPQRRARVRASELLVQHRLHGAGGVVPRTGRLNFPRRRSVPSAREHLAYHQTVSFQNCLTACNSQRFCENLAFLSPSGQRKGERHAGKPSNSQGGGKRRVAISAKVEGRELGFHGGVPERQRPAAWSDARAAALAPIIAKIQARV